MVVRTEENIAVQYSVSELKAVSLGAELRIEVRHSFRWMNSESDENYGYDENCGYDGYGVLLIEERLSSSQGRPRIQLFLQQSLWATEIGMHQHPTDLRKPCHWLQRDW